MTTIKNFLQDEQSRLKPYAISAINSVGRKYSEAESENRSCFQRDRDRVLHSKAWRRLKHKTQVFLSSEGDHYRDRLTHSLEVAHIARDVARILGVNEDLAETIALAHDLGHTPFGHSGEEALNECLQKHGLQFEHNQQSRRIVEEIERVYPEFPGLNLSLEVIDGLVKHQSAYDQPAISMRIYPSIEAQIVNCADEIAYSCHDIDDGLRAGLITIADLKPLAIWQQLEASLAKKHHALPDPQLYTQRYTGHLISIFCDDLVKTTNQHLINQNIKTVDDVYACSDYLVCLSDDMKKHLAALRTLLQENVYFSNTVLQQMNTGRHLITTIFEYLVSHPDVLRSFAKHPLDQSVDIYAQVRDYVAGMTDSFAHHFYNTIR